MSTKTPAWTARDGSLHASLEEAQAASLASLFADMETVPAQALAIAKRIIENASIVKDELTTTKRSHPRARTVNGAKRKPRAAAVATTATAA